LIILHSLLQIFLNSHFAVIIYFILPGFAGSRLTLSGIEQARHEPVRQSALGANSCNILRVAAHSYYDNIALLTVVLENLEKSRILLNLGA
jgi:hypothetical protein